ncbi:hypothetical protein FEM48_Zijuj11G0152400 [Ziziphus jujuba var. spinosa]|uniref:Uncharacterized protein n=1 Tax=Ziziphus jujuba var. spinosa TaxID=714518 RepID=A0A978UJP4_ZIZJJ|nr:hypothetical protein FEM48_Zijuj11G0152400 [Ziziphus jujuba var. spinosa]
MNGVQRGNSITNQTLETMPKYQGKEITAVDKAYEALIMKNVDNKDANARKFVESLKPKYSVVVVTTTCLICNATGNRLTYNIPSFSTRSIAATIYIMVIMRMDMLLAGCWLGPIHGIECSTITAINS